MDQTYGIFLDLVLILQRAMPQVLAPKISAFPCESCTKPFVATWGPYAIKSKSLDM